MQHHGMSQEFWTLLSWSWDVCAATRQDVCHHSVMFLISRCMNHYYSINTHPKINMEPEKYPLGYGEPSTNHQFSGSMLVSRGVWGLYYCPHYLGDYLNTTQCFAGVWWIIRSLAIRIPVTWTNQDKHPSCHRVLVSERSSNLLLWWIWSWKSMGPTPSNATFLRPEIRPYFHRFIETP